VADKGVRVCRGDGNQEKQKLAIFSQRTLWKASQIPPPYEKFAHLVLSAPTQSAKPKLPHSIIL